MFWRSNSAFNCGVRSLFSVVKGAQGEPGDLCGLNKVRGVSEVVDWREAGARGNSREVKTA